MTITEKNNILLRLGKILHHLAEGDQWPGYDLGINEDEYNNLRELIETVHVYNGWFKEQEVKRAFKNIASWLNEEELSTWVQKYPVKDASGKKVAIIMAGNIPLVGFHDFLSVFLAGHIAVVKMSSEDRHLFPALIKTMSLFDERIWEWLEIAEKPIGGFDAVIATGSDNSARYFESYFGKYPNIIRKNRSSIAVLTGEESEEELQQLGHDIFDYYGLGCRNVAQIWLPQNFEINRFFEAIYDFNEVINHHKYANNYDYNRAVFLLNDEKILDNGFLLLKEDASLHSPLAVLHYQRYDKASEVENFIGEQNDNIQVVVGRGYLPFGSTQCPNLDDYADGVNTMEFLTAL